MATRNLKRKRACISYREPSSDDDTHGDSEADYVEEQQPSTSRRSTRRTRRTQPQPPVKKASRSGRRHVRSYKEPSSDEESEGDFHEVATPQRSAMRSQGKSVQAKGKGKASPRVKRVVGTSLGRVTKRLHHDPKNPPKASPLITDGIKPAWVTLPYHVLLQIFVYASHPLYDDNLSTTSSVPWLLNAARLHSNFAKPALTALYRNPPLFALNKDRRNKLMQLLLEPGSKQIHDYRVMVKRLELDVTKMPHRSPTGRADIDFGALVTPLKTLREIEIFDPHDRPPYRQALLTVRRPVGRHYPPELFTALEKSEILLRTWTWNYFLCPEGANSEGILWIKDIHGQKPFQNLRDLVLTNFPQDPIWDPSRAKEPAVDTTGKPTQEELLGSAFAALPNLRSLSFVSSTIVNDKLLPLLPNTLVSVTIANCGLLTSDMLGAYLLTHGNFVEELILNHNQSLDLSFLPDLGRSCPRLEVLRMDMNLYSSFATSRDADPKYDELLKEEEMPTWPSTLQVVDLVYLRKWSGPAAKTFFTSLIDSAEELPDLRELVLKAMVDVNWRERAAFRDEWIPRFKRVFLARPTAPTDHLVSFRAFRTWKSAQANCMKAITAVNGAISEDDGASSIVTPALVSSTDATDGYGSDSDKPILLGSARKQRLRDADQNWVSKRLRDRKPGLTTLATGNESDPPQEVVIEKHIQGRCRVVDIRIDNLRPREEVFSENDFLDSEVSGDEDWNSNNENDNDGTGYAW